MTYRAKTPRIVFAIALLSAFAATCSTHAQEAEAPVEELPEVTIDVKEPEQTKYPSAKPVQKVKKSVSATKPKPKPAPAPENVATVDNPASDAAPPIEPSTPVSEVPRTVVVGEVIGSRDALLDLSGSGATVEGEELYQAHVLSTNEALRKVPGVVVRDEEGLGIRPNIGIRGLNPTRSTKTLLLEDGLFLTYAPYGDNASYFHPSLDRFERVEVLKGADQLRYGPQTISGTINYVTPNPPAKPSGFVSATGGSRDYFNGQTFYGGWFGNFGGLVDYVHKEGQGARDNTEHKIDDFGAKGIVQLSPEAAIIAKTSYFREESAVTYSGITDAEMQNYGIRYNPFDNDAFDTERFATSLTLNWDLNANVSSKTSLYWTWFSRDWWRQASTTTDTQCAGFAARRAAGSVIEPDSCNSIQGRLRDYFTHGIEQRWEFQAQLSDLIRNELRVGWRLHREDQERKQINSFSPWVRPESSGVVSSSAPTAAIPVKMSEHNEREARAVAGFIEDRIDIGPFSFTPVVRFEDISYDRTNRLALNGCIDPPCAGDTHVTETIPGLSIGYAPMKGLNLFAGIHEGFAPPRVEDSISNTGSSVEVDAEASVNIEAGLRTELVSGLKIDATYFRNEFSNLVAVGSVAGGNVNLAQGEALFEGAELAVRLDSEKLLRTPINIYTQIAWTYLWTAEQVTPFLRVDNGRPVTAAIDDDTTGNRQPYAPEHAVTARLGVGVKNFDAHIEMVYVGEQYADFQNFETPEDAAGVTVSGVDRSRTGLFGKIDDYTIFNLGLTYTYEPSKTDFYFSMKNMFDEEYIVDRTRGILPGSPQLVHFGVKQAF